MKRTILIIVCTLAVILLNSCSGKNDKDKKQKVNITIVGTDGSEYDSYQECCSAADFVAAHRYIDKMESQGHSTYEARNYVFREEALYLMSLGDDNAKKRIVYLLKQDDGSSHDSHCNMLVELAIDADDEDFVKTLTRHYKGSIDSDILRKIVEYLYIEKGDDSNLDFVTTLLNRYDQGCLLLDAAIEKRNEGLVISLVRQFNGHLSFQTFKNIMDFLSTRNSPESQQIQTLLISKVAESKELFYYALENNMTALINQLSTKYVDLSDKDLLTKLSSRKNRSLSDAIIKAVSQKTIPGRPFSKGLHGYYETERNTHFDEYKESSIEHYKYADGIQHYNAVCNNVLDIAIGTGNQYLAQKVLMLYKQNIVVMKGSYNLKAPDGTSVDGNHSYVYYTNEDKEAARNKYNEAVRSGAFK